MTGSDSRQAGIRQAPGIDPDFLSDNDVAVLQSRYPSGVRDFVLHRRIDSQTLQVLNPLELLGTPMAVQILELAGRTSRECAAQFSLSRLLVQCLEYRGSQRHLIVEPWDDDDLRGIGPFDSANADLIRDCSVEQAERYRLLMSGTVAPDLPEPDLYWGTFSTLPIVEGTFDDPELGAMAKELLQRLVGEGDEQATIKVPQLRKQVRRYWKEHFSDFELGIAKKHRRALFKKLMSVAVRQASTMIRSIAFGLTIKNLDPELRKSFRLSEREERLFELRYGSFKPTGNINIGFLFVAGELHTELINNLGRSLVSDDSESRYADAELALYRHTQCLAEMRDKRKITRADQRQSTRKKRVKKLPLPSTQAENQPDASSPQPSDDIEASESLNELKKIILNLKPRDRVRVQAIIDTGGDKRAAAKLVDQDPEVFMRRYRQSTQQNVNAALECVRQQEEGKN